jgi:TetR/AcrR family transcriptional regulator, fatty acid metabolism regulator protein
MKQDKRDQRRKEILEAAIVVFAHKGYYTATVSDIANKAGIAQGTMYLYFKSKEDLLIAIFQEGMRGLIDYVKAETEKIEGAEAKLKRLIEVHIQAYNQYRDLAQLVLIELRQAGKFLQSDALEPVFDYLALIGEILEEGIKEGVFYPSLDTELAATMLYSTIDGIATRWVLQDFSYSLIDSTETVTRIFFRGILTNEE